jgi:microcompartment protein CcmK/EutM
LVVQLRLKAIVRPQLDTYAQGVVEKAAGAVFGLGAVTIGTCARQAVGASLAGLAFDLSLGAGRGLSRHLSQGGQARHPRHDRELTPAAGQAAAVDASAIDVGLVGILDTVVARRAKSADAANALVALAVLVDLAGLRPAGGYTGLS